MKKSIFLFFAAILCAMSVQAKNIYVDMSSAPSWYDNAHIHYWDGSNDKYVKLNATSISKMYVAEIADNYQGWRVCRYVSNTRYNDCTWVSDKTKNKFTVNSNGNGGSSATIIGLVTGGYILFDNSLTKWSDGYRYFVIGHDTYYKNIGGNTANTLVSNTQLWCMDANNESWPDAKYFAFLSHDGNYPTASKPWSDIETWGKQKTSQYTNSYSLYKNSIYLCVPTSGTGKPEFTISHKDSHSALNNVINVKTKLSTDDGVNYIEANVPCNLQASSYEFSAWNKCNTATSLTSGSISCGYTANTTLTAQTDVVDYEFVGWYDEAGVQQTTNATLNLNPKEGATYYAYYKSLAEETHEVTISYKCGNEVIQIDDAPTSATVGESTAIPVSAPPVDGYKFANWTLGAGVASNDALTANPIDITTKAGETDYTLTANYEKLEVVYFVNNKIWSAVKAYAWDANENKNGDWPGVAIEKTGEKIGDYDVYYYCIDREVLDVEKIIFNNGNGGEENQTKNYAWVDGKYYWHGQADDFEGGTKEEAVKYFTIPVVAGSSATLFQTTWDITNTANEMGIQADGTYTLVKSGVTLAVETIEYKVVIGHYNWEKAYGDNGNNATLEIETSGKYNVTFTYNPTGNVVSATAELLNEEVVVPTVAMHGNFLGSWEDTENFTIADNKETAELEMLIEKGNYEFGMRINGSGNWTANGSAFTSTDNENVITENGDKMTFAANKDGYYTFTWTYETNTLTITYPTTEVKIERTFTVAGDNRTAFGETWAPANTANDMILQADGTYKWTKTQIALKKDTEISFKVVKNHDWNNGSWPGEAWVINTIDKDGYYTIDITFDLFTKNITVTATWTGEAPFKDFSNQPATLYFHPSFHWTSDNAEFAAYFYNEGFGADAEPKWADMTDSDGDGVYEVANAKQHEYVIICRMNPSRTENKWDDAVSWNKIETGITIPNTAGNLNTCIAFWKNSQGDVPTSECTWVAPTSLTDKNWSDFVTAYAGQTINAVIERSFKSGQYHTLCLPFDIPTNWLGEGTEAYQLTSIVANNTGDKLSLNATKWNTIVAGQPYIIVPVKGSEYEHVIINGVTVKNVSAGTNVASGDGYKATLKAVTATDGTKTNGSTEYYVGAKDGKLYNAQTDKLGLRAIIELTTTSGQPLPPKVRAFVAAGENVETGVEDIIATDAPVKVIVNGQLIIIRDGIKYNVQGQVIR